MMAIPSVTSFIAAAVVRFLLETDGVERRLSKAKYLRLLLDAADIEAEVDEPMMLVGTGDGGRRVVPAFGLLLVRLSPHSRAMSITWSPSDSFPFPLSFPLPLPLPLLDEAGLFEAAPQVCCKAWKACIPFTLVGMRSLMRS